MTNKEQFDSFIVKYLNNAQRLVGVYIKNPDDAADVVHTSIEKALQSVDNLKDSEAMRSWFDKILINASLDFLRKQSKSVFGFTNTEPYYFDDFSHINFESLLELLPPEDREILIMRYQHNTPLEELADTLGMNLSTLKSRLYRSLRKLKLKISDDETRLAVTADIGRRGLKNTIMWSVAFILSGVLFLNAFPTIAAAAYDIPVIGDIIKIVTFNRFSYSSRWHNAEINLPEIQGLLDSDLQERLNSEFHEYADDLIRSFEATIIESDAESAHVSIKADYAIKTDNDRLLAVDAYLYSDVASLVVHKLCTIDKLTGTQVTLPGLFIQDSDYISPISAYIIEEMLRLNSEENATFEVGDSIFALFTEIKPDNSFYINEEGKLVICFDKYEVAAGIEGSPEFVIPYDVIGDILATDLISED